MKKIFGNTLVFSILYIIFIIPTYLLPYVGSNSAVLNAAGLSSGAGINPAFWPHLAALILLILIGWFRGANISKKWLVIFPILALVFDLVPGLSSIPLIPTIMHLSIIIMSARGSDIIPASIVSEEST